MMDYSQAWMGPWGQALQASPFGGLMSPWAMGAQGAQGVVPQTGLQSLMRGTQADGNAEGTTPANGTSGPQTPGEQQAAREALGYAGGYARQSLGNTALGAIGATAMGMSPSMGDIGKAALGGLANPTGLSSLAGKVTANQMGFAGPQAGWAQKAISYGVNPVATGLLSAINPALGLAYGLMSPFGFDLAADALDGRKDESIKDAMEDAHGPMDGRSFSKEISDFAGRAGFGSMASAYGAQGYGAMDAARGMTNKDAGSMARGGNPMGNSYGASRGIGFSNAIGGPAGGARSVDVGYGPSMGGFAGLGIGNPSSYGGGNSGSGGRDNGGFGSNDGDSDTAGNGGYGR